MNPIQKQIDNLASLLEKLDMTLGQAQRQSAKLAQIVHEYVDEDVEADIQDVDKIISKIYDVVNKQYHLRDIQFTVENISESL